MPPFSVIYSDYVNCVCCVSVTSFPLRLSEALKMSVCVVEEEDRAEPPGFSCNRSMGEPLGFRTGHGPPSHTK